ncbi:aminotransferase class I/II-fold pyridoxal phosphate-dependent enzyme [Priestia abyssalis]|uniref:aminotransferase class I/II-fold pyridoxal phosphate-dependent enzyme n=1 Tax=Priestia abyssalis TaxID=1221450 RepID=UPI000994CD40|nr:aminotransferase class I/II-fold pyridoxal phosphate-dependent enzyme [Priestia abyssalis]
MKHILNPQVQQIEISGIRQFAEKINTYQNVISLTIGQPDFPTPDHIKEAGKRAIDQNMTSYAHTAGLLELREAASDYFSSKYGLNYSAKDEILVTNGATEAIFIALRTILNEGDEVLLPTPAYSGYEPVITLCGGKTVCVDTTDTAFKLTKEQVLQHLTSKTKAVILGYPSNPTGAIMTKEELEDLSTVLKELNIYVVADEIYSELIYGQQHASIASIEGMRDKTIVLNGLSKSHAMTGWRIGFTLAPEHLTKEMIKVHQYTITSINTIAQAAAVAALTDGKDDALVMKKEYEARRDYLCRELTALGFELFIPEGAFYIFPSIKNFHHDSYEFSVQLLEEAGIGVLPSTVFTNGGKEHIRISYAYSMEKLEEAIKRLKAFLGSYEKQTKAGSLV